MRYTRRNGGNMLLGEKDTVSSLGGGGQAWDEVGNFHFYEYCV